MITTTEMVDRCHHCGREMTEAEAAKGWPIHDLDGLMICPSCYGDEAYCCGCGELMSAYGEDSYCDSCC